MENSIIRLLLPWLNRLGIVFNFIAGFMLAPNLIGLENLAKLEVRIRKYLSSLQIKYQDIYSDFWRRLYPGDERHDPEKQEYLDLSYWFPLEFITTVISFAIFVLGIIVSNLLFHHWYYGLLIWLILPAIGILLFVFSEIYQFVLELLEAIKHRTKMKEWVLIKDAKTNTTALGSISLFFLFPTFLQIHFLLRLPNLIAKSIFEKILDFISLILNKFREDTALQAIVVTLGIILFIIGSLFQLIATF